MASKRWPKPDPYPEYRDGNCRDISGRIVFCGDPAAVSPAKEPIEEDEDERGDGE